MKYGVNQCVGDTICAGGIMYGQRTIPVILDICKDVREVSEPDALFLNYSNPNAMNTWAANTYGGVRTLGLCHGVQHGHAQIAKVLDLPVEEVDIICAGINHQTWYIQVLHKGKDMRGKLLEGFRKHPDYSKQEKVRIDILEKFGYYSTESNGHLSEYLPWYRKRPGEIDRWIDYSEWIHGEPGGYLRICREARAKFEEEAKEYQTMAPSLYSPENRSTEHGSHIIEALETGRIYRGHFNVINNGAIANLPADCVVEVPGYVDGNGISIPLVGDLPFPCAAICGQSIAVQRLSVEAAIAGDPVRLKQAMLLDPLVGAVCNPPEVWAMTDEMLKAQSQWLPQYQCYIKGLPA
jgi:alpha-galactosidase